MLQNLTNLIDLQTAETRIHEIDRALAAIPARRKELDAALDQERQGLSKARTALEEGQKGRRQNEGTLQDMETRRSRYRGQLMEVKTNKEYSAMLQEIEGVEREIRQIEDLILEAMEGNEALSRSVAMAEGVFKEAEERHKATLRELEAEQTRLEADRAKVVAERDKVAATLPEDVLELFQRVANRRGEGVAEARDGQCQLCHVVMRPQMFVDVKRNDDIRQCPSCSRILYFVPEPPTVVVEP